jgi:hypothetical protein
MHFVSFDSYQKIITKMARMQIYYAIHSGGDRGVYNTWSDCQQHLTVAPLANKRQDYIGLKPPSVEATTAMSIENKPLFGKFQTLMEAEHFAATGLRLKKNVLEGNLSSPTLSVILTVNLDEKKSWMWKVALRPPPSGVSNAQDELLLMSGTDDDMPCAWLQALVRTCAWCDVHQKKVLHVYHNNGFIHRCIKHDWVNKWAKRQWKSSQGTTITNQNLFSSLYRHSRHLQLLESHFIPAAVAISADSPEQDDLDYCGDGMLSEL